MGLSPGNLLSEDFSFDIPTDINTNTGSFVDSSGNSFGGSFPSLMNFGGSLLQSYGYSQIGKEEAGAYEYNANLALEQGQFQIDQLNTEEPYLLGTQRAMYAKAGVAMSGSPLDVALHSATNIETDKQITRYNAQSQANMDNYEAQVARSQAKMKSGMSLLSGAAELAMFAFL